MKVPQCNLQQSSFIGKMSWEKPNWCLPSKDCWINELYSKLHIGILEPSQSTDQVWSCYFFEGQTDKQTDKHYKFKI